ncbi:hypothetical protein MXMO3_03252 [Maritalea myrionectae]|uniref:Uncharacterized protein n=1 Tax=Maritalea myrionectae TaxID=454601 RepID=A0A2R4MI93_9HYPH|nr:extracellular solute-binding protein [Maritalea myrionectae]AVX05758.1 hypothetical protein MXMO3_03252 [Maritalea myrionectae]
MTRDELIRILDFADTSRQICSDRTNLAAPDARWNIISYSMRRHLEGKLLTITSAASASGVPYGTAMRRITELIDEELLHKRPRSNTGRSFSLHPTRKLIREFESYALQLKAHVGKTFGFVQNDGTASDFFFGGSYMTAKILSFPNAMRTGVGFDKKIKILCSPDPTFRTLKQNARTINELCGTQVEFTLLPLNELYAAILQNHELEQSEYDIVNFDLPWLGKFAHDEILRPLSDLIENERYNSSDFHTAAWKGGRYQNRQYGIPIQPTTELLFYRSDLLNEAGLTPPQTTEDVLLAARTLHKFRGTTPGIVMNYGRGLPVAHTFVQTLADFGQPIINLQQIDNEFDVDHIEGENFRPMIDTEAGHRTAEFLKALLDYAHPKSLKCSWDERIAIFAKGDAAMTYGWSVRAAAFGKEGAKDIHDKIGFTCHPSVEGKPMVSPIGGFCMGMPANLSDERRQSAWKVMEYLARPEMMKWYVQNGSHTSPRFSTSADPEVQSFSKMLGYLDTMERQGMTQNWPRPPVPEISGIFEILGNVIHQMLLKDITIKQALLTCQNSIDHLMRENGRYK